MTRLTDAELDRVYRICTNDDTDTDDLVDLTGDALRMLAELRSLRASSTLTAQDRNGIEWARKLIEHWRRMLPENMCGHGLADIQASQDALWAMEKLLAAATEDRNG